MTEECPFCNDTFSWAGYKQHYVACWRKRQEGIKLKSGTRSLEEYMGGEYMAKLKRATGGGGKGGFLTAKEVGSKLVVTIASEPEEREGDYGIKYNMTVKTPDGERTWAANKTSYNTLFDEYGDNGEKWIGQKVKLETETTRIEGKKILVIYGSPA